MTLPPRSTAQTVAGCRLVGGSVVRGLPLRSHTVSGVSHRICVCLGPVLASRVPRPSLLQPLLTEGVWVWFPLRGGVMAD